MIHKNVCAACPKFIYIHTHQRVKACRYIAVSVVCLDNQISHCYVLLRFWSFAKQCYFYRICFLYEEHYFLGCLTMCSGRYLLTLQRNVLLPDKQQVTDISYGMMVNYQTAWCHIPEDSIFYSYCTENLTFHVYYIFAIVLA